MRTVCLICLFVSLSQGTHHNTTKPAEVSQGLTIEGLRILTQETSSQGLTIEGLRRLMQETSDENDKIKDELFEQADEIEAQVSRMRSMIKPREQESSTPPRPDDAITSSHNVLSESIGHEETPHKPCEYGQKCRFLLQERCSFWHHPKTISLPGSGRFTSRNIYPGTEHINIGTYQG